MIPPLRQGFSTKDLRSDEEYQVTDFSYKVYPVHSFIMNKVFKIYEEKGLFAEVPQQPPPENFSIILK